MSLRIPLTDIAALDASARARLAQRPPIHLYRMVAHAPGLLGPFMALGAAQFNTTVLPPACREALVLRVAMHHASAYEIHHHRRMALDAGLSAEAVDALLAGSRHCSAWSPALQDLAAFADELVAAQEPEPARVRRLVDAHGHRGYVEAALIVGFYRMVATFIHATGLEPETADVVGDWKRRNAN
jgi:alkylhydroperoxidase family enzyme